MHHAPAAQVLHPHRGFEPMSQLQHGLSSYAANVKETTGLFANCLTSTLLELLRITVYTDRDMRLELPQSVCVDSLWYVNGHSTRPCCT